MNQETRAFFEGLIAGLRSEMKDGFAEVNRKIDQANESIDSLARITSESFTSVEDRLSRIENELSLEPIAVVE